jgi:hypothetical protein
MHHHLLCDLDDDQPAFYRIGLRRADVEVERTERQQTLVERHGPASREREGGRTCISTLYTPRGEWHLKERAPGRRSMEAKQKTFDRGRLGSRVADSFERVAQVTSSGLGFFPNGCSSTLRTLARYDHRPATGGLFRGGEPSGF